MAQFYTNRPKEIYRRENERGSAITETMLLVPPVLMVFNLLVFMMIYWQDNFIDHDTRAVSEVARQNSTGLLYSKKGDGGGWNDKSAKKITYKVEDARGIYKDSAGERDLPKRKITITEEISENRKFEIVMYAGVNSWLSFPWLRGQSHNIIPSPNLFEYGDDDDDESLRKKWFDERGNEALNDEKLRKNLQLGT